MPAPHGLPSSTRPAPIPSAASPSIPGNPLNVWVGTGENNSQRSVGFGDGVYKSVDGGSHWENVGLKTSEHIGKILVDPRNSNIVFVAAQGPLWAKGGDRGLYRTEDGGKTWKCVLETDPYTGASDVIFEPGNPDVMYASTYQRQRRVWTLIDGGPGSALYKSDDAGATWRKLENGLPEGDLGRIGLAVSPVNPKLVYAMVEAADLKKDGFYRSTDAGGNWEKMSDYRSGSPQYYQEIFVDPKNPDRVYSMDTWMHVTEDGGKTFRKVGETFKHVDNHALWIDPDDTDHLIAGCDGGLYQTFDRCATWAFSANLPGHAVLQGVRGQRRSLLQRLRGHAGQQHVGRALAHDHQPRHHELGLVHHRGRRRLPEPGRSAGPQHRLLAVAARGARTVRPAQRRGHRHPTGGGTRRGAAALELGLAARAEPPLAHAALHRRPADLPHRRSRRFVETGQPRSHAPARPQSPQDHGSRLEHRRGGQERLDVALRKHRLAHRVAAGGRAPLRRHRRRPRAGERGRRRELAQGGELPRRARADLRVAARRLAPRRVHRLRRVRQSQDGRLQAVRAEEHRSRQELEVHRRGSPRAGHGVRAGRGSRESRICSSPAPSSASSSPPTAGSSGFNSRRGSL